MDKITTAKIADRLGGPPAAWTFSGQCFDAGEQNGLRCAILQQPSQYFFTLKAADGGPEHRLISLEAIRLFRARNPELYRRLAAGIALLEMQNDGFDRQKRWREERGLSHTESTDSLSRARTQTRIMGIGANVDQR
jgi:hypothetical protein